MRELGLGNALDELKNHIQKIKRELKQIEKSYNAIPEIIESTNLLRENESLRATNGKKDEIISAYEHYTKQIENLLSAVFEIQNDLRDILKDQSELLSSKPKKRLSKSASKKRSKSKTKRRH